MLFRKLIFLLTVGNSDHSDLSYQPEYQAPYFSNHCVYPVPPTTSFKRKEKRKEKKKSPKSGLHKDSAPSQKLNKF